MARMGNGATVGGEMQKMTTKLPANNDIVRRRVMQCIPSPGNLELEGRRFPSKARDAPNYMQHHRSGEHQTAVFLVGRSCGRLWAAGADMYLGAVDVDALRI